ncbi:hypothetical protein HII36_49465 [Nonomuraea sp. NN258]|uniref:hypothetical protein n=1 Tax=Nonomuraea antri TaxID=2730852 RepID=UPI0015680C8A|nr:hypothetical protein [Nonomuraea antri]NRQ39807.1 hypothetical protein [Nonomuraea antri]
MALGAVSSSFSTTDCSYTCILSGQIDKLLAKLVRDRGHLTAKLAVVVIQAEHDPARAAHLGHEAHGAATQTSSARIRRELRTLDGELCHRWPDHADAKAFHEALATV